MPTLPLLLAILLLQIAPPGVVTGVVQSSPGVSAVGVRVYAQQVRDTTDPNSPAAPLEGLVQTDAAGRYRLELPPGRYYIASGSVSAPTYFPGTRNLAEAKLVTVTPGGTTDGIDFASFVVASRSSLGPLIPGGILSGVVQNADGRPAVGVTVVALPWTLLPALSPTHAPSTLPAPSVSRSAQTDGAGRYWIQNVPADTYFIVAGYLEDPGFHTGGVPAATPKPIAVAAGAAINALDVTLPSLSPGVGTTVSGRVMAQDDVPAAGATVRMTSTNPLTTRILGRLLPSINAVPDARVAGDGTFRFSNVVPGHYNIQAWVPGVSPKYDSIDVAGAPIDSLRFSLATAMLSGRVVLDDGSAPHADLLSRVALATTSNPNLVLSTILPLGGDGMFAGIQQAGEFRFYLPTLPVEYEIRSITADTKDLLKETLKLDGSKSAFVDVRLARTQSVSLPRGVKVTGTVLDSVSKMPSAAARIVLCCQTSGAVEGYSAALRPDGSFELSDIVPGTYFADLKPKPGQATLRVAEVRIQETSDGLKLEILSGGINLTPSPPSFPFTIGKPR